MNRASQRSGHTLEVNVTLVQRDALALWRYFVQTWQDNSPYPLVASLSLLVAALTFWERPRNRAAQYLLTVWLPCSALDTRTYHGPAQALTTGPGGRAACRLPPT